MGTSVGATHLLLALAPLRGEGLIDPPNNDDWWRLGGEPPANFLPSTFDAAGDSFGNRDWFPTGPSSLIDRAAATLAVPIETIRLGQRVIGENPEPFDVDPAFVDPLQSETRRIVATVFKEDGTAVDVEMLRDARFVDALGLVPGSLLPLQLAELDVQGIATVTEVTECPPIQQGEGQVVTARFVTRHAENRVRVTLSDGTEIIATDVHPFWANAGLRSARKAIQRSPGASSFRQLCGYLCCD